MKILALHLHSFITYAQLRGIPPEEIMAGIQMPAVDFREQAATVSAEDFYSALSYIEQKLDDELLGLRMGQYLNLAALGLINQISLQASTIEEGLLYLKSFLHATLPIIKIDTVLEPERVMICLKIDQGKEALNRILLESTLTIIHRELIMMGGEPLSAHLFSPFQHKAYPSPWARGEEYLLSFKPVVLKAAIRDKSRLHLDVLVPQYLKLVESIQVANSFSSQVKIASLHMAKPELPDLAQVADVFNLTPRTLQRQLKGEKHSFRQITDELKKQISYLLIHHDRFTVADLAYVLGYAEPAAFIHSFKKWFGHSPQKFRQQLRL